MSESVENGRSCNCLGKIAGEEVEEKLCAVCTGSPTSKRSKTNDVDEIELRTEVENSLSENGESSVQSPFSVNGNENFGQYLEAAYDLKVGVKVLDEVPCFYGPSADFVEDYDTPLCLGCCVVMNDGNEANRCTKCQWPICSQDCDKVSYHEENECGIFSENQVAFPPNLVIQHCYKGVAILRGLLIKERQPKLWGDLMTLQYRTQLQKTVIPDFGEFKQDFGLRDFGENEDWARILGILNVNSYSIQRVEKKKGSPTFAEFIYPVQSLMAHSCVPNCTWAVTYSPQFIIKVRPTVDIKVGEMLTVPYNFDFNKYGCHKRQAMIRDQAEFDCRCSRCLDPTDLGTFGAAVTCFKCKMGFLLPLDSSNADSDWKCNECNYTLCQSFVVSFVDALHEQVEMAEAEAEENGESIIQILEDFIEVNSGTVVHANHWVLAEASQQIVNKHCCSIEDLTETEVERLLFHCQYLLKILDVTAPGISTLRGILHHHLARALLRKTEMSIDNTTLMDSKEIAKEMRKVSEVQQIALAFWKNNPHYGTLHEDYKSQAKTLIGEIERVKVHYNCGS